MKLKPKLIWEYFLCEPYESSLFPPLISYISPEMLILVCENCDASIFSSCFRFSPPAPLKCWSEEKYVKRESELSVTDENTAQTACHGLCFVSQSLSKDGTCKYREINALWFRRPWFCTVRLYGAGDNNPRMEPKYRDICCVYISST